MMPHATQTASESSQTPSNSTENVPSEQKTTTKPSRPKKPNYNLIHRFQLPVEIHPLPPLIPHNPLSIIAIALSYLTQIIRTPSQLTYNGYFSSATSSIHITDEKTSRALWEMGFFGKGNLSRSEPAWLAREKQKGQTSEEATGKRRNERKEFKLERAKKEQQEIAEKLRAERTPDRRPTMPRVNTADIADIGTVIHQNAEQAKADLARSLESAQPDENQEQTLHNGIPTPPSTSSSANATPMNEASGGGAIANGFVAKRKISNANGKSVRFSPTIEAREFDLSSPVVSPLKQPGPSPVAEKVAVPKTEVENQEHLELSLEEAFFLAYGLGILKIFCDDSDIVLDSVSLLSLFRRHSYFPPHPLSIPAEPDDPFMISYVAYHHFRSLGWVVRSGVKFSVDYLLYNRGPVFSHAEFATILIPAYSDPYWSESQAARKAVKAKTARSWSWLHGVNRVQSQVRKSLVLCYVDVPPPLPAGKAELMDIGALLKRYRIREVNIRRWTPNRSRD